jgi:hypothetical protein
MSEATDIPPNDATGVAGDRMAPPIIDLLYYEPAERAYIITFIPEEAVSRERTESVQISATSADGRRIGTWLEELGRVLGLPGSVRKLFHRGGGDFGFYGPGDSEASLPQAHPSAPASQPVYVALQDLAQAAQTAFLLSRRPPADDLTTLQPRAIAVELRGGQVLSGSAEGNNASWLCACGYRTPLLGTTRSGAGDTRCPNCGRVYRVHPYPHRGQKVTGVKEVEPARATG